MDTVVSGLGTILRSTKNLLSSDGLLLSTDPRIGRMSIGSVEEWLRPAFGAMVILGASGFLLYVVIRDYRPADPAGFVSVGTVSSSGGNALASGVSPKSSASVPARAQEDQQGPCRIIAAEFSEVRAALARPQGDAENSYLKRRFQELRSRAHASNCLVMPGG